MSRLSPFGVASIRLPGLLVAGVAVFQLAGTPAAVATAARRDHPDVNWRGNTIVSADFTCEGRRQHALLGVEEAQLVLAIFADGTDKTPTVIRLSRNAGSRLALDSLDFDPQDALGGPLRGFERSSTCKGLVVNDGQQAPLHVYWNHEQRRFAYWSR